MQIHRFGLDSFHLFSAPLLHYSKETEGSEAITQIERYGTITFVLRELIENRKNPKQDHSSKCLNCPIDEASRTKKQCVCWDRA